MARSKPIRASGKDDPAVGPSADGLDADPTGRSRYVLYLYVSGMTPRSQRAIENIRKLCDDHMQGCYDLEIIDIYQQPERAKEAQIVAAPTLVKTLPQPLRRLIGDLSEPGRVLVALGVKRESAPGAEQ